MEATQQAHSNLNTLIRELEKRTVARKREIRTLVVGLVAGQHTCLLGDPGTGKSYLARLFAAGMGFSPAERGDYFELLLTKQTKDIEVLGAWKLQDVKQDAWNRKVEGKLPGATVALLDEIFKCNSGILNGLLTLLNEGLLHQDAGAYRSPLRALIGCSNELPDEDDNLAALWDRMVFRHWVEPVTADLRGYKALKTLKHQMEDGKIPTMPACATIADALAAAAAAPKVSINAGVDGQLFGLIKELRQAGVPVSDRKINQMEDSLRAHAWLDGAKTVSVMHFDILRDVLWNTTDQKALVNGLLDKWAKSPIQELEELCKGAAKLADALPLPEQTKPWERDAVGEKMIRVIKEFDMVLNKVDETQAVLEGEDKVKAEDLRTKLTDAKAAIKQAYAQLKFAL